MAIITFIKEVVKRIWSDPVVIFTASVSISHANSKIFRRNVQHTVITPILAFFRCRNDCMTLQASIGTFQ